MNKTTFRTTFRNPVDNLLYNAVPLRVKGRARAFIGGLVVPLGALTGGVLLLVPGVSTGWLLPALIGGLAVAYPIGALITRKLYSRALITMLEQEDFSFLLSHGGLDLIAADPATLKLLKKKLDESPSPEFTLFMAQLISRLGGSEAVPILEQAATEARTGHHRAAILDTLTAAEVRGRAVRQFYTGFLTDADPHVRHAAIAGLEQLAGPTDEAFISLALGMLADPDPEVRAQILSALARSGKFFDLPPAVAALNQFLTGPDLSRQAAGVRILGQIDDARVVRRLVDHLTGTADEVRLAAVTALETVSKEKLTPELAARIFALMPALLRDPVERVRQATLTLLEQIGSREAYRAMVNVLADPSPPVRAAAVKTLAGMGKAAIPIVHPQLDSPDPHLRKMAAVVLSHINRREFGDLIKPHVTANLLKIYQNYGGINALSDCAHYSGISVLQNVLGEQNQALLDEIFYLLGAVHNPDSLKIITGSLHSESARVRANAIEALESLTTPQTTQLITPLFEPEPGFDHLLRLSRDTWDMPPTGIRETIEQIAVDPDTPWLRVIVAFALGEMGGRTGRRRRVDRQAARPCTHRRPGRQKGSQTGRPSLSSPPPRSAGGPDPRD